MVIRGLIFNVLHVRGSCRLLICEHRNIILRTPTTKFMKIACSHRFLERSPCSHGVRKKKNQQLPIARKLLIFNVDQPGLEPGTSRL